MHRFDAATGSGALWWASPVSSRKGPARVHRPRRPTVGTHEATATEPHRADNAGSDRSPVLFLTSTSRHRGRHWSLTGSFASGTSLNLADHCTFAFGTAQHSGTWNAALRGVTSGGLLHPPDTIATHGRRAAGIMINKPAAESSGLASIPFS